ncbi:LCP family protein [Nocardioides maradonensis]
MSDLPPATPVPAAKPGRRRRRRQRRWVRPTLIGLTVLLVLLGGAAFWGYRTMAGKIHTFDAAGVSAHRPNPTSGENVLLIGTDSRAGESGVLGGRGDAIGRSDTTILVHVFSGSHRAVAVSIPRDSLVTIPSCRLPDGTWTQPQHDVMFNSAFSVGDTVAGNPACTQNTVEKLTGLRIDHTVVANFAGFAALSDAVGGVPVCVPNAVYQDDLRPQMTTRGRLLFHAGRQLVEGTKALDYVRIRHGLGDGSDIGRIKRQQAFLSSMIDTIRKQGLSSSHLLPLVDAATANLTFDSGLGSPLKLLSFAMGLRHLQPSDIDFVTVPWRYDGYRVAIVEPAARRLWAALRNDQPVAGTAPHHHRRAAGVPKAVLAGGRTASMNPCANLT